MKSKSKNPFWVNSKLEESCARIRMFQVLEANQCEVTIRPDTVYVDLENGDVSEQQGVGIFVGDSGFGNNYIEMNLTLKEAREFANYILNMVNTLEKAEVSGAENETN